MAKMKFSQRIAASKVLLLTASTCIILSAAVVTEEIRKCYWCGPLADQVHRSTQAPACDAVGYHVTACDPELAYCAVVATSPPYIESRLCVKLYQDECYPLFCNSTKTWKMTCPCRGDLCNGPNTDREVQAFDALAKLATRTRTTRIKKRTQVNTVKFMPSGDEKTVIITNISALDSNELNNTLDNNISDDRITQIMLFSEPMVSFQEIRDENMSTEFTSSGDDMDVQSTEATSEVTELTEKIPTASEYISTKVLENKQTRDNEKHTDDAVKPSEHLPTAEALQQNTSPKSDNEKATFISTYETTFTTNTEYDLESTTETSFKPKNRSNTLGTFKFLNIILTLIIFQCV